MCIVMFEAGLQFSNRRGRYLLLILAKPILESKREVPRNRCDSHPWIGGNNRNRSMPSKNFHALLYYSTPWSGPRPRISMLMIAVWFDFHHWNLGVWGYGADCLPFLPFLIFSPIYGHHLGVVSGCKRKGWWQNFFAWCFPDNAIHDLTCTVIIKRPMRRFSIRILFQVHQ